MNEVHLLLSSLRAEGVQLWVHEGELRYRCLLSPLDGKRLSEIRRQKQHIIAHLEAPSVSRTTPLASQPRPTVLPLSYAQEGLWFLHQLGLREPAYNFPTVLRLEGALDLKLLERAVKEIVRRHEILRTRFQTIDAMPAQIIDPAGEVRIEVTDLSALEAAAKHEKRRRLIQLYAENPFDLAREQSF